jgi:hypothetical protein
MTNIKVLKHEPINRTDFVCFRCGNTIKPNEKMNTIVVSLELPGNDGSLECIGDSPVLSLCFRCAAVLIARGAAGNKNLMMPQATGEEWQLPGVLT